MLTLPMTPKVVNLQVWQKENEQFAIIRKMFKTGKIGKYQVKTAE
jgi:hypothetical protein